MSCRFFVDGTCNLAYASLENKDRIRSSGAIDSVIALLYFKLSDEDMAYNCLVTRNISNSFRKNQVYFESYGGIGAPCKVMERYSLYVLMFSCKQSCV